MSCNIGTYDRLFQTVISAVYINTLAVT